MFWFCLYIFFWSKINLVSYKRFDFDSCRHHLLQKCACEKRRMTKWRVMWQNQKAKNKNNLKWMMSQIVRETKKIVEGQEPKHKIRRGTKNQKTRRRKFKF